MTAPQALEKIATLGEREIVQTDPFAIFKGLWARALLKPEPFRRAIAEFMPVQTFAELVTPCKDIFLDGFE